MRYGPSIRVRGEDLCCAECGFVLGGCADGYEAGTQRVATALGQLGPHVADDPRLRLVLYLCPGCRRCLKVVSSTEPGADPADRRASR